MKATTYLMLLLAWGLACAQGALEVIELRHTTAERVMPTLRPLLEPGGVMTGQRNQLVVRTSPGNLAELRKVLEALDRAPRRLVILVRFERPRLAGDEVILEVSPQRQSPGARGQAAFLGASTTVRGRLGTWIELAGHENVSGRVDSGIAARTRSTTEERRRIWVKVEEVAP